MFTEEERLRKLLDKFNPLGTDTYCDNLYTGVLSMKNSNLRVRIHTDFVSQRKQWINNNDMQYLYIAFYFLNNSNRCYTHIN